jgi:endoglucanase
MRRALGAAALSLLAACANLPSKMDSFPPVPTGQAPGASELAIKTANNLGRGINFGNMLEAPKEGDWGFSVTPEFIEAAKIAKFDTVRLPVRWSNHALAERPYTIDPVFMRRVEQVVNDLVANGFNVILNAHHNRPLDGDPADPGDAPQVSSQLEERFLTLWQQVAAHFFAKTDKVVFELYNEPHGRLTAERWNDLQARALGVVRQYNPKRVVLITPVSWGNANALASLRVPNDPHLIVNFHHYEPFKFTHQGAFWVKPALPTGVACCDDAQRAEIIAPLDVAKAWSEQNRYPVYLGEFGSFNAADMDARVAYTRIVQEEATRRGISWAYWELASNFGIYDPGSKSYRGGLVRALMGPDGKKR